LDRSGGLAEFFGKSNENSDGADVTSAGKLFQTRAAATEKKRSPMVERRVTQLHFNTELQSQKQMTPHRCQLRLRIP